MIKHVLNYTTSKVIHAECIRTLLPANLTVLAHTSTSRCISALCDIAQQLLKDKTHIASSHKQANADITQSYDTKNLSILSVFFKCTLRVSLKKKRNAKEKIFILMTD